MWKTDIVVMLRSLIGDLDREKFTDERLRQIITVGAYNVLNDADFANNYTVTLGLFLSVQILLLKKIQILQCLLCTSLHVSCLAVK